MKDPHVMTAAEINKALDRLDTLDSQLTQEFIDAGRGYERASEILAQHDPLANRYRELWSRRSDLRYEIERRYGPGAPSRLPRGFGPIKTNPLFDFPRLRSRLDVRQMTPAGQARERAFLHSQIATARAASPKQSSQSYKGVKITRTAEGFTTSVDSQVWPKLSAAKEYVDYWKAGLRPRGNPRASIGDAFRAAMGPVGLLSGATLVDQALSHNPRASAAYARNLRLTTDPSFRDAADVTRAAILTVGGRGA